MAYPARPKRATGRIARGSTVSSGNGSRSLSPAGRLAVKRVTGRRPQVGGSVLPTIALLLVGTLVTVIATSLLAAGGAAGALLAQLEQGLPDVHQFEQISFAEPTVIYASDGKYKLATFYEERRQVVTFRQIPQLVLDATTSVEDRTFWTNEGYDLAATLAALAGNLGGGDSRGGGSTITQQLVRAQLLPKALLAPGADQYVRKAKEIIQAAKLTEAFPGEVGKQRIITAYLNQIFYGHNAYGIAAAADIYFRKKLPALTPAEAALLAGLPKSPSVYDPYRWAKKNSKGEYVVKTCGWPVPPDCVEPPPAARRDYILSAMAANARWTKLTPQQLSDALNEPIVLAGERSNVYKAPHFVWAMKARLDQILSDREPAERGGYTVITTLDPRAQRIAEKYVKVYTVAPNLSLTAYYRFIRQYRVGSERANLNALRGKGIYNGALTAIDYKTGDVLAYVGSSDYYARSTKKMNPKYDVAGVGYRAPGSAFKPIVYATAIDERVLTAGTVLLDITTPFSSGWVPQDADQLERGPVLARKALQYSLNIPAIRTLHRLGNAALAKRAIQAGMTFIDGRRHVIQAGLAAAIGTVEIRQVEMVAAFGAFANGGVVNEPRYILKVIDAHGKTIWDAGAPTKRAVWSPQAAWIIADILSGNSDPKQNVIWGPRFALNNGPGGTYRPAAVKTGTTNDIKDLSTYGFLPKPQERDAPAIALGVWMGNSDNTAPRTGNAEIFATDGPGRIWYAFMRDYMRGKPTADFVPPVKGLVQKTIDAYTGGVPGPWTIKTTTEWFIEGTQPTSGKNSIDKAGLIYTAMCGTFMVDPVKGENPGAPGTWKAADRDWAARARSGPYTRSRRYGSQTAYFFDRSSWGGAIVPNGPCVSPSPSPGTTPAPGESPIPEPAKTPKPTKKPNALGGDAIAVTVEPQPAAAAVSVASESLRQDELPSDSRWPGVMAGLFQPRIVPGGESVGRLRMGSGRRRC